jgi:6,7-dimethyl-8-ribityllumazine synthase
MLKAKRSVSSRPSRLPGGVVVREAGLDGKGLRMGIVVSRFNAELTEALCATAIDILTSHGVATRDITVVRVPGAFEIPLALQHLAVTRRFHALIALGAVIQGETPHARLITNTATQALARIALDNRIPVIDGILAANTEEQARVRALSPEFSRGAHAANAALAMANLMKALKAGRRA